MKKLLITLTLALAASSAWSTTYNSDGSEADVQAKANAANNGDTITLPVGTFNWFSGVAITKAVTISGRTVISGAGTANCSADDQTVIVDKFLRQAPNLRRLTHKRPYTNETRTRHRRRGPDRLVRGSPNCLFKATIPAGTTTFRLTGITFKFCSGEPDCPYVPGTTTTKVGNDGAIRLLGTGLVPAARIDHCHFNKLVWNCTFQLQNWIYGVDDHNLWEASTASHAIQHDQWNGHGNGNGSYADFPYYGSEKFWFLEDNTIRNTSSVSTGAAIDIKYGGRFVARHNYWIGAGPGGHGTEGGPLRGQRAYEIYNNTFYNAAPFPAKAHRGGSTIWHDNTWNGANAGSGTHTSFSYYRVENAVSANLTQWGLADGENGWDSNDTTGGPNHDGVYLRGTSASGTAVSGTATFTPNITLGSMVAHAFKGYQVRNDHVGSASYLHSAIIMDNTDTTITYYYYGAGDRGPVLVFNIGDEFSVRKVNIGIDQAGRGKGDLIDVTQTRRYPNQQQETCFSWNNKNADTGQVIGIGAGLIPFYHEGAPGGPNLDYVNLGAGLPANTIPAQVTAAYPASVNGIEAYTHEYTYPHPLVAGGPSPTPTPTPTASPSATSTATPTATRTPTSTPTPAAG